jgi:hypothetical protein
MGGGFRAVMHRRSELVWERIKQSEHRLDAVLERPEPLQRGLGDQGLVPLNLACAVAIAVVVDGGPAPLVRTFRSPPIKSRLIMRHIRSKFEIGVFGCLAFETATGGSHRFTDAVARRLQRVPVEISPHNQSRRHICPRPPLPDVPDSLGRDAVCPGDGGTQSVLLASGPELVNFDDLMERQSGALPVNTCFFQKRPYFKSRLELKCMQVLK